MRLFGLEIVRKDGGFSITKALPANLQSVSSQRWSWDWNPWGRIVESFPGAWQRNVEIDPQTSLLAFSAVFACVTGIANDISKLRIKLDLKEDGIWSEIEIGSPFLPVLRKPNHYQTRIDFLQQWIISKLLHGNSYILKQRDERGIVTALYVLDPMRVTPLVAEDGSVYYRLAADHLSELQEELTVPASAIIHDRMCCLWHPLVGISPIYACGVSATMGNRIQANSTNFFGNMSRPSGILSAPGHISDEAALRVKQLFETSFGGVNVGRMAVLGDGLKFETVTMPAEAAQLIEQLRWTVEDIARAFHYPQHKLGGPLPPYSSNLEALNMSYYSDCLQIHIESIELRLDEGLELPSKYATELDLDGLARMDTAALYESNNKAVGGGWMAPDEARHRANMKPVPGGDTPYLQQQYWSLAQLSSRKKPPDGTTPAEDLSKQLGLS